MEDRHSLLAKMKARLLSLNYFSSASSEMSAFDDALELMLDIETAPSFDQSYVSRLSKQLSQCEVTKKILSDRLYELETNRNMFTLFDHKTIGIVGGHPTEVMKLKYAINAEANGAKIKFKETSDGSVPNHKQFREKYGNVDLLVALTGYVGHSLSKHVDLLEKEGRITVIRSEGASGDLRQLLMEINLLLKSS